MIKAEKIKIKKFRCFKPDSEFIIGDNITLIAGLNGTAKSTLLGMICQPLGFPSRSKAPSIYTRAYDNIDLLSFSTIAGNKYKAEYSDVFRISQTFDIVRNHEYKLFIKGDAVEPASGVLENGLDVRSEKRKDQKNNELRFVVNSDLRDAGVGNYPHPVIYLGLERLRPLSTLNERNIIQKSSLSDDEFRIWQEIYKYVMVCDGRETILAEKLDTGKFKNSYHSVKTAHHDGESASAGQDNLGQIITAILSFYRLKKALKEKYQGGILLIDEFDATLHPIAQILLMEKMIKYSKELNLQIISTTHSLVLLEESFMRFKKDINLLYLRKRGGNVELLNNVDFNYILSDIAAKQQKVSKTKIVKTVLFEDSIAASFFKKITGNIFNNFIKIYNTEKRNGTTALPNDVLKKIAERIATREIPEFKNVLYILDPDSTNLLNSNLKNLIVLPGCVAIEKLMYRFLFNLADDDSCWENKIPISKANCFLRFNTIDENAKTEEYKKWFNEQKSYFGNHYSKLFDLWVTHNPDLCRTFCVTFLDALLYIKHPIVKSQESILIGKIQKTFTSSH